MTNTLNFALLGGFVMTKLTENEKLLLKEVMNDKVVEQPISVVKTKKKGTLHRVSSSALKYV